MAEDGKNADYSCFNEGCFRKRKDFCNQDWRTPYRLSKDDDGNIQFIYENGPIDGAFFTVKAAEDILSADQQGDIIYEKG